MPEMTYMVRSFEMFKPVAFPEIEKLEDLGLVTYRKETPVKRWGYSSENPHTEIAGFLSCHGLARPAYDVNLEPKDFVLDHIRENMIPIDYDTISFELVEHKVCNMVLVIASYSQIIGSRWLAYVTSESVYKLIDERCF